MRSWIENMKKFVVFRKLSVQLIATIALSCLVSMGTFLGVLSNLKIYSMDNEGNISSLFSYAAFSIVFIVPIVIFIIAFLLLVRKKVRYIKYISEQVNKITKEDLGVTLNVVGNDEIAELCENINCMSMEMKESFEHKRRIENEKSELITSISHDLRAPITAITEYLYILENKRYKSKEEEQEHLSVAYNLSIKLKKIINELFEYTKLSSRNMELKLGEVDLGFMIIKILEEYTPRLEEMGVRIRVNIDEEILVKIDYEKIIKAFNNILSDVEKYGHLLSDLIIKVENKAGTAHIVISNKGKYLEYDKLNVMFESLNRIDTSKSMDFEESELSLGISKKVIELHHGSIWAEGHGTRRTIHIKLPISQKSV